MTSQADNSRGIVVVGAGLAAAHVVSTLRDSGYRGTLTLIGDEGTLPYERPPLSKDLLTGTKEADSTYVHDTDWYATHDIELRLDDPAVALDRERRAVTLRSGATVPYTDLVLATGASPRTLDIPGVDLDSVHLLRTLADSLALRAAFAQHHALVVIGAGWIGLEVAAAAKQAGLSVTVLEYADTPLKAAMGTQLGRHFLTLHERHGVDLRTNVAVDAIEGVDGHVIGVRANGVIYPADLVVVGVGATPNVQLAQQAGLDVDDGIVTDTQLRTTDPRIFAAGDVANAHNTALGTNVRVEHWDNAIRQGTLAARVLLGGDEHYDWQPYFYTDQFDLGMEYVGFGQPDDDVIIRGDQSTSEFIAFWLRGDTVTAAMNVNIWDVADDLRATIGHRIDRNRLADDSVKLADLGEQSPK